MPIARLPIARPRALVALLVVAMLALAACGGSKGSNGSTGSSPMGSGATGGDASSHPFVAQVASYDLFAGRPQRFLAALAGNGTGTLVGYGTVDLTFSYLGRKSAGQPVEKDTVKASYLPVAGQHLDLSPAGPKEVKPSDGIGVYEAMGVVFDSPGFWSVRVKAKVDGKDVAEDAAFEVADKPAVPFPGTPAPRTDNPTMSTPGVDLGSIESRAHGGAAVPDPELHQTSIAAALAAGKPLVVVVSTPVYCISRFCGPITDSVEALAKTYGDRAAFVHLEVWSDYEQKKLNPAAQQWAGTPSGDLQEPWVFLVGRDGVVKDRFDNVASDEELAAAVSQLVGP
ncbi:MAG TPA: hypothetical protein VHN98_13035 [Acidimicrobiales bacterium]|nr:hypothetical protein [Acidimicrobiales bacterium]